MLQRTLATAAALLAAACLALPAAAQPAAAQPAVPPAPSLKVEIVDQAPNYLTPDSTLVLTVRVRNDSNKPVEGVRLVVNSQVWTPITRNSLLRWIDPNVPHARREVAAVPLPTLTPHASTQTTLEIPAAKLRATAWGPRGIEVLAVPPAASGNLLVPGLQRSWVVWWPSPSVEPLPLSVLLPLTASATEIASSDTWQARWHQSLKHAKWEGITAVTDPATLKLGGPTAQIIETLRALPNPIWALPTRNADLAALLSAGRQTEAEQALNSARPQLESLGLQPRGTLPGLATPTPKLAELASDAVVIDGKTAQRLGTDRLVSAAHLTLPGRELRAAVIDPDVTSALSGYLLSGTAQFPLSPAQTRAFTLAATAVALRERPADYAMFLQLDPSKHPDVLEGLKAAPWVKGIPFEKAFTLSPARPDLTGRALANELPSGSISANFAGRITAVERTMEVLRPLVPNGAKLDTPAISNLPWLWSATYRDHPADRENLLTQATKDAETLRDSVAITSRSAINMVSASANFPVSLRNKLNQPAEVRVKLTPSDNRMKTGDSPLVTLAPGQQRTVEIPVTAHGSGDLQVSLELLNVKGELISPAVTVDVRIRADWESFTVWALTALAIIGFAWGVISTIRRNRLEGRTTRVGTEDPDVREMKEEW